MIAEPEIIRAKNFFNICLGIYLLIVPPKNAPGKAPIVIARARVQMIRAEITLPINPDVDDKNTIPSELPTVTLKGTFKT